jgi:hypothetical protein
MSLIKCVFKPLSLEKGEGLGRGILRGARLGVWLWRPYSEGESRHLPNASVSSTPDQIVLNDRKIWKEKK